jgi:hypothetical protein
MKSEAVVFEPWDPPTPPNSSESPLVNVVDPRVIQDHQVGVLPCPANPPPPVGWAYWIGPVLHEGGELAVKMLHDPKTFPMGSFVQMFVRGSLVGARVEWHNVQGATGKTGCFRGVNLMHAVAFAESAES